MVESNVVSGKVIEQRGNVVITVQGGLISSYDLRYYSLPANADFPEEEEPGDSLRLSARPVVLPGWKRHAFSGPPGQRGKKSAYRA